MTAKKKKDGGQRNPIMPRPSYMWIYVLVAAFIIGYSLYGAENTEPVRSDWNTVEGMVRSGDVERIEVVNRDVAEVFLKKDAVEKYRTDSTQPQFKRLPDEGVQLVFNIGSVDAFREDLKAAEQQSGQSVPVRYENKENGWMNLLVNFLPWVLIIGVWFFIMRGMSRGGGAAGGGLMNVGKAKAQVYDKDAPKRVTFKDVAGLEEAKVEVMEIVDFLRKPEKYRDLGAKIPKGALLVGPPGTGKTLLARPWPARPTCRSFRFRVRTSWRCSSAWVLRACAICSSRPSRRRPASSSSTRSTRSVAPAARTPDFRAMTNGRTRSTSCLPRWTASRPIRA